MPTNYLKVRSLLFLAVAMSTALLLASQVVAQTGADPKSSVVAITFQGSDLSEADNAADYVKDLVEQYNQGSLPEGVQFPLLNSSTDSVRTLEGFNTNVVISWLDPLTWDNSPEAPRFGANNDYLAYFGEGWDEEGAAPQFSGSGDVAWMWVNHEYISGTGPTTATAPAGQHAVFANALKDWGVLQNDVTAKNWDKTSLITYTNWYKKQLGGSWMRIVKNPATGEWAVDRSAANLRYDATSNTQSAVVGYNLSSIAKDDAGKALPEGVVPGILANCSGGQSPWGTVFSAEENTQDYYGDLESWWSGKNGFVLGAGADPGSVIKPNYAATETSGFGLSPDVNAHQNRDSYAFLSEIDPGVAPITYYQSIKLKGDGVGHRKVGAMGRAHWENNTFVVDENWQLLDGKPIVMYAGDDRRNGRIYKFVSANPYKTGMSKAETRALLDEGKVYVAHFAGLDNETGDTVSGEKPTEAKPGTGQWLELSLESKDLTPNGKALGNDKMTVGEALKDVKWNGLGGFSSNNDVLMALHTASAKIGVMELNRPEDVEWNPVDLSGKPRLYVVFTKHGQQTSLDENGVMYAADKHDADAPKRPDPVGSIFALEESDAVAGKTFTYFSAWQGGKGQGAFDVANPDNIMLDADGGVWFGTDGNFEVNKTADALYYLDLDPAHKTGAQVTFGQAFRVIAGPSDSEATGPAFSSDMQTIFYSVQHPGEGKAVFSRWPNY